MENLGITGVSFVYCTKFCVFKIEVSGTNNSPYLDSLSLFEDQFAVISSVSSQEMRKVYRAMSPS